MSWSAIRAGLRIARRDAWRHRGRSALIIAMVTIPVFGLSCADVLARTMQLSPTERMSREIGQADVGLIISGGHVEQGVDPLGGYGSDTPPTYTGPQVPYRYGSAPYQSTLQRALRIVAPVGKVSELRLGYGRVQANGFATDASVEQVPLTDPITQGITTTRSGKPPANPLQVAVTPSLAHQLDIGLGDKLTLGGIARTVTGVISYAPMTKLVGVWAAPGTLSAAHGDSTIYIARTARPVSAATVARLNAIGVAVFSKAVAADPPAAFTQYDAYGPSNRLLTKDAVGVETVAIGLAILEVGLLAGAAFAVGARRQRHDLALVAAVGGDAGNVRSVVLGSGLVLGLVGSAIGIVLGIALAPVFLPYVAHRAGHAAGPFDVRPLEILGVALLGMVTGLAAAILPARAAARDDVVLGLTGRRGVLRSQRKVPVIGVGMIIVGIVVAVQATHHFHFRVILGGAVLAELGFVVCAPALVGLVGRLGRYVGLAPRLALRDAARHRGRTGPAVAAIMAAVAGSIALSTFYTTINHDRKNSYLPEARIGQPWVATSAVPGSARYEQIAGVLRNDLGASRVVNVRGAADVHRGDGSRSVFGVAGTATLNQSLAVGDPSMLGLLTGRADPAAVAALNRGDLVVFDQSRAIVDGLQSTIPKVRHVLNGVRIHHDLVGHSGVAVAGLITASTAQHLGIKVAPLGLIGVTSSMPSQQQVDRAEAQLPYNTSVTVDRGYHSQVGVGLLVLALVASIVTLGATAVAVGLSMAESRPDLMTLTAVGARPRTRRLLVASQAGTVSLLGAVQGVIAGLIPAWAILRALSWESFQLPWPTIALVVLGIPLLAMIGTAAAAGSRLSVDRRLS